MAKALLLLLLLAPAEAGEISVDQLLAIYARGAAQAGRSNWIYGRADNIGRAFGAVELVCISPDASQQADNVVLAIARRAKGVHCS